MSKYFDFGCWKKKEVRVRGISEKMNISHKGKQRRQKKESGKILGYLKRNERSSQTRKT